jgi:hypothetical protein
VNVRLVVLDVAARTEYSDLLALGNRGAARDPERPEVKERERVAVTRLDRDRAAVLRQRTGEADHARRRREDGLLCGAADVDPAMLACLVLVRVHDERTQDVTGRGPGPGPRRRRGGQAGRDRRRGKSKKRCCQS